MKAPVSTLCLLAVALLLAAAAPAAQASGDIQGKPQVGWFKKVQQGYCVSSVLKNGCLRPVFGWDITGNVDIHSFDAAKGNYCDCAEQCALHNGVNVAITQQCQFWVYNPANAKAKGGAGSCTLYVDSSPGFSFGEVSPLKTSGPAKGLSVLNNGDNAGPVPKGNGIVSGIMFAASTSANNGGVQGYIC